MSKNSRQTDILNLIKEFEIEKQEELVERLNSLGHNTTQTTVSRDINELKLIKVKAERRPGYKYKEKQNTEQKQYLNVFKNVVKEIKASLNLIVIKTVIGSANPVAALLDQFSFEEIIGVIAGDDTIFVAVDNPDNTEKIVLKLKEILNNGMVE